MIRYNVYFTKEKQPIGHFVCYECYADREFDTWRWQNGDLDAEDVEFGVA